MEEAWKERKTGNRRSREKKNGSNVRKEKLPT